jgi:hypothetical protein
MSYTVCKYKVPCPDLDDVYAYDSYIKNINEQKKVRHNLILDKLKSIKENSKENELLEDVKKVKHPVFQDFLVCIVITAYVIPKVDLVLKMVKLNYQRLAQLE